MYEDTNIFDFMYEQYKIHKPIRLIELFAGIGSQAMALKKLNSNFEHWRVVEFDKYAIASYNAIHDTNFPTLDITQIHASDLGIVDTDTYDYIMTYSFPCQDLSLAGKRKGFNKGESTRSGLLWEVERLLDECENLPQILLMENVPQVHSTGENMDNFQLWLNKLESLGYSNYWQDLNAKDYGVPQTRNRCFCVSILGGYNYKFPKPIKLEKRLKDLLEDSVDEKYYLSEKMVKYISAENEKRTGNNGASLVNKSIASTVNTRDGGRRCDASNYICDELGEDADLKQYNYGNRILNETLQTNDVEDGVYIDAYNQQVNNNVSGTITTGVDFRNESFIAIKEEAVDGDGIDISGRMEYHRGTVQSQMAQTVNTHQDGGVVVLGNHSKSNHEASRIIDKDYIAPTFKENHGTINAIVVNEPKLLGGIGEKLSNNGTQYYLQDRIYDSNEIAMCQATTANPYYQTNNLRIRKLTPLECWRLMAFPDEAFYKAQKVNSNAQLYKQAGNSIVVDVLVAIFRELIND